MLFAFLVGISCSENGRKPDPIDDARLAKADDTPEEWLSYGRNYAETRYSPLNQINADNVDSLGLAWSLVLGTKHGFEATPIVANGVMYFTGPYRTLELGLCRKCENWRNALVL